MEEVVSRLRDFMDNEARSCSMDYGCITPFYVYRMWGGSVSLEEITQGLMELRKQAAWLRINGFTNQRICGMSIGRILGVTDLWNNGNMQLGCG